LLPIDCVTSHAGVHLCRQVITANQERLAGADPKTWGEGRGEGAEHLKVFGFVLPFKNNYMYVPNVHYPGQAIVPG